MSGTVVSGRSPSGRYRAPWHHNWRLLGGLILFMGLNYAFSDAFSTGNLPLWHRLALWWLVAGLMVVQPVLIDWQLARLLPRTRVGEIGGLVCATLLSIPLMAMELEALKRTPILPKEPDPWMEFIVFLAPPVVTVAGFVLFLRLAWEELYLEPEVATQTHAEANPQPDERSDLSGVLYVQAQDHYLEIVSDTRRRFVRGRLGKYIGDGGAALGTRCHRSWWVADRAVVSALKDGRDWKLVLADGQRVPVARSRVEVARERGWLREA
ncbi:LytTR family DNA-binding domain-containing protein [Maricaulis sp.]|uniref:LytTR family DNA-binding domain-containing protein n=1 Tax=Maricaulis sp. TaxID=1486257 RepID=UPI001B0235AE|nr:LytTR family DNA-binding domain-containing protein [Maricaulis sp.]MBO6797050.1 LytTR family transcriptional regulator [Maricaulis sp.]